jgi:hypothetical protein
VRLWSIHPQYLDSKGLVGLWREALLARAVLNDKTAGYQHHPQLIRFRAQFDPIAAINAYLQPVFDEACRRSFHFNASKIVPGNYDSHIPVTEGQLAFEFAHFRNKMALRDSERYRQILSISRPEPHPIFNVVPGQIEFWEKGSHTAQ